MKILHVIPHFLPSQEFGGTPVVVDYLCHGLARQGHTVHVLTTDVDTPKKRLSSSLAHEHRNGYEVFRFPNVSNWLAHRVRLSTAWKTYFFLRQHIHEYDVIHLHEYRTTLNIFAALFKHKTTAKYVLHPQGTFENFLHRTIIKSAWDKLFAQKLLSAVDVIIAVSELEKKVIRQTQPGLKIVVLYNPIDSLPVKKKLVSVNSDPYFLYIGRLAPQKGLEQLFRQFASLNQKKVQLLIAGNDDGLLPELKKLVSTLSISNQVKFIGTVSGQKKVQLLAGALTVIYVTEHDAFGLVPCEAALAGSWPVYSSHAGVAEVLQPLKIGSAVSYGDEKHLLQVLKKVLLNHPRITLQQQHQLAQRLSIESIIQQLEKIYERSG